MKETDLIQKLQALKTIDLDEEWLVFARQNMINAVEASAPKRAIFAFVSHGFSMRVGLALSAFLFTVLASGTLVFAGNSLPGDPLYAVKIASEGVQNSLPASPIAQAQRQEASAERRVQELAQVAQNFNASSDTSNASKQDVAPAVTNQVKSYQKALQQNAATISDSKDSGSKADNKDIAKAKDEADVIQKSAQTLAIVLHQADNGADLERALRATVANRLPNCKDQDMYTQIQKLLSSDEIADLISANELSVRCIQGN